MRENFRNKSWFFWSVVAITSLLPCGAFADEINYFDMKPEEVAAYGFQAGDTWYARVEMPPRPPEILAKAEPHMIRLIGELSEDFSPLNDDAEDLNNQIYNLTKYLPSQCGKLLHLGYVKNKDVCVAYVRKSAEVNKHLHAVILMNFKFGTYKNIKFQYVKR